MKFKCRLNSTKEIPDDPSPIITVLQNVISILDAQNEDSKTQISCPQQTDREEEHEDKVASELFISEDRIPEEEFEVNLNIFGARLFLSRELFQIFEVDMALEVDPHLSKSIDRLVYILSIIEGQKSNNFRQRMKIFPLPLTIRHS
jgi:hypothetical protein